MNMAIEIVSFPIYSMVMFHSYVNVYLMETHLAPSGKQNDGDKKPADLEMTFNILGIHVINDCWLMITL